MTSKLVVPRQLAFSDIDRAIAHYVEVDDDAIAIGFVDALEKAMDQIGKNPGIGSPRFASELNMPGLRCWATRRYPYQIFYFERDGHVDVWRVFHSSRDIPAWIGEA